MSDDFVENVQKKQHWLRIFYMLVFLVALYVSGVIILVLVAAQALFTLISGSDNANLRRLGNSLSIYVQQILQFLTYNSEQRPFPFSPFPVTAERQPETPGDGDTGRATGQTDEASEYRENLDGDPDLNENKP